MTNPLTVADLCRKHVITIDDHATIREAAESMRREHVGSLVVVHGTPPRPVGMLTDRDIAIVAVARDFDADALRIASVMSDQLRTLDRTSPLNEALQLMRDYGVRRLPVLDEHGYLAGILTFDDLLDIFVSHLHSLVLTTRSERKHESVYRT
jgi:CBS-domain-containing membrane protein